MSKPKGFTLIEILVVISIIILLVAIIMPALRKVRRMTKRVICASNLRQLTTVALLYATDNEGKFMIKRNAGDYYLPYPLYLGGQTYIDNGAEDLREMFQPYLMDFDPNAPHEVMFCPANIRHSKEVGFERVREQWRKHNIYYMGYAYWGLGNTCIPGSREYVSGWDWVSNRLPPERSSDNGRTCLFSDPTERFLVSETWWGLACHTVKGTEIWSDLPPEGMNNARIDGSVDWRICEDYIDSWDPSISIDWGPKLEVCMEYKGRVYLWGKR